MNPARGPSPAAFVRAAQKGLQAAANPKDAPAMQAYLKTTMPFYGVKKPAQALLVRELATEYAPLSQETYQRLIASLWDLPHREEKYLAIALARRWKAFIKPEALPLYERMIREGGWWDFVDDIAKNLVGAVVKADPKTFFPVMARWLDDDDLWMRRTALLCQLGWKEDTDQKRLFSFCEKCAHEKEFFIRKAIGWALRELSYTDPDAVRAFVNKMDSALSPLSQREALKAVERENFTRRKGKASRS